jgi:hypothetical protein
LGPIREVFNACFVAHFFSSQAFVFILAIRLRLTLTPRVLGTLACVCCFCECFCRMKKLSHGLKKIFSPGTTHHGSGSHSLSDGTSLDTQWFSSSMPLQHEATPSSHQPVHVEMPPIDDDNNSMGVAFRGIRMVVVNTIFSQYPWAKQQSRNLYHY